MFMFCVISNPCRSKPQISSCLKAIQSKTECKNQDMSSFLILPMQRVTRMPLLVEALLGKVTAGTVEYQQANNCLSVLQGVSVVEP